VRCPNLRSDSRHRIEIGLRSPRKNSASAGLCSARLQAGTFASFTCPPEGGRYIDQSQDLT
jgi:hypothetical protein